MSLIRDPWEWATDNGWVSELRARRAAERLRDLATKIEDTINDEGGDMWAEELRSVAKYLSPKKRGSE